jgi:hypothetical protein
MNYKNTVIIHSQDYFRGAMSAPPDSLGTVMDDDDDLPARLYVTRDVGLALSTIGSAD